MCPLTRLSWSFRNKVDVGVSRKGPPCVIFATLLCSCSCTPNWGQPWGQMAMFLRSLPPPSPGTRWLWAQEQDRHDACHVPKGFSSLFQNLLLPLLSFLLIFKHNDSSQPGHMWAQGGSWPRAPLWRSVPSCGPGSWGTCSAPSHEAQLPRDQFPDFFIWFSIQSKPKHMFFVNALGHEGVKGPMSGCAAVQALRAPPTAAPLGVPKARATAEVESCMAGTFCLGRDLSRAGHVFLW